MPKAMEAYRLSYSGFFEPVFEWVINHAPFQFFEYFASSGCST